jgi:hypothetical protein
MSLIYEMVPAALGCCSSEGSVALRISYRLKYPSSSAGFEPANLGSNDKHVTTRPPRVTIRELLYFSYVYVFISAPFLF